MATTNIRYFPYQMGALTNITPFTYRDGTNYLEQLEQMRVWLNEVLVPDTNKALRDAYTEYVNGLGNAERYVDEAITFINNKTGQAQIQRTTLTSLNRPYVLNIDPLWPDNHPIDIVLTQDEIGDRTVTLGENIVGELTLNPDPETSTEFTLIPQGDGTWKVFQLSTILAALTDILTTIETLTETDTALSGRIKILEDGKGILTAPNGVKYRLGVTNGGTLTLTDIA